MKKKFAVPAANLHVEYRQTGDLWEVSRQIAALRHHAGLSQKELARLLKTSQQAVSRLESPNYQGHSLSMLRRVAEVLKAKVSIFIEPMDAAGISMAAEIKEHYGAQAKPSGKKRKSR